ncbi:substrate-binding domain-containing protein [Streptomyces sporangiiformans]|uniref:Substrate-binding domain-containing protein n=1 Tax=Streptomyces sporangiiformans TaxID=2315329 RepID=A0A505DJF4_9ACTN|nr:substrate-binding domain-containing protein [Streptomyces sporangiiformans]TPQ18619.1 substrate-binding domain-containing protein [Streptomyces sporangiiformans]
MSYLATPKATLTAVAALSLVTASVAGCTRGSESGTSAAGSSKAGCPDVLADAKKVVSRAKAVDAPWTGPTTGPEAAVGKTIVYVAQSMTNPGVAGAAEGVEKAVKAIGWKVRVIDGQGTPGGIQAAVSQAVAVKPDGIVLSGFDPKSTAQQVAQANAAGIPLIGWHAVATPGPSKEPKLFTNITTKVEAVAEVSADWIISQSNGRAGVVVFTDASIPFAKGKSDLIEKELATCSDIDVLATANIPIADVSSRTPQEVSALISRFGSKWTNSVAINDLYFADAAPALRSAGRQGDGAPFNIGAGDGDPSAFQRLNSKQYQAATVPEPLSEQGWQIVDEFNRAFANEPASGYIAPVHITTADNSGGGTSWDPQGYREAYRKIWGN